jgi:O-antigen/teichoic acid export membrane protein
LFFIWQYLSIEQVINGILVTFILALIGVIVYIYWLGQLKLKPDFSLFNKGKIKEIRGFAFYSFFSNFGNVLAFRIDMFMVPTLLDFKENGIYAIALFIAGAIAIPTNAITQISGPIVAESLKNNDLVHVKQLYQSSSINLLVVGLLLFVCIMVSIEDLFSIMPKNEELTDGLVIVFLIGLAKIIDMATSINNQIINYSKYYRFGFYAILLMAAFNITANLILIPKFQIIGAAVATLLSLSIYNLVKMIFIHWKFKIQPFTWNTLWVLLIAVGAYGIGILIPATEIAILDILLKSVVIGSVYSLLVYYLKISEELNNMLDKFLKRLRE